MNDPEQQLQQALNSRLFPSTPYRFNAGGDPWRIPALDYEALNAYHRRHYHPGNAVFLSAGSLRPEWLQVRLHELALARFSRRVPCAASRPVSLEIPPLEAPVGPWCAIPCCVRQARQVGQVRRIGSRLAPRALRVGGRTARRVPGIESRQARAWRSLGGSGRPRIRRRSSGRSFLRAACWSRGMRRFAGRWRRRGVRRRRLRRTACR